jgi:hypothetical protein
MATWLGLLDQIVEAGGALAMAILSSPRSVVQFCNDFLRPAGAEEDPLAPAHILEALPSMLTTIALSQRRRSQTELGRFVLDEERSTATVTRTLQDRRFHTRDLHRRAVRELVSLCAPAGCSGEVEWLLAMDAVSLKRGSETKIPGANHYRGNRTRTARGADGCTEPKKSKGRQKRKGRAKKPKARKTKSDPKDFPREGQGQRPKLTQIDLAKVMIQEVLDVLPPRVRLIVVADTAFNAVKLFDLAQRRGFVFIVPADTNRCFANPGSPGRSNGKHIYDRGLSLPWEEFDRVDLVRGKEKTVSLRRYANRKPRKKDRRTYWMHHECGIVAKLGEVGIVHSWKSPVYEPKPNFQKKTFKVLLCTDRTLDATRIVELYEIRWTATEILFRELKQDLGFGDFTGTNLEAMERFLDLVLITLMYLEVVREEHVEGFGVNEELRHFAVGARTRGMQSLVRLEVTEEIWRHLGRVHHSRASRRKLKRLFEAGPTQDAALSWAA